MKRTPDEEVFNRWRQSVNMTASQLKRFLDSPEGKAAGLSRTEARSEGIKSGRQSARMLIKMIPNGTSYMRAFTHWTPTMWEWARRQNSFIARMRGNSGSLYDHKGRMTRKLTSLLLWGHDPR